MTKTRYGFRDILGFLAFSHGWTWTLWAVAGLSSEDVWQMPGILFFLLGGAGVLLGGIVMSRLTYGPPACAILYCGLPTRGRYPPAGGPEHCCSSPRW